jgi:DNA excision repair protein ERCC-4
MVDHCDWRRRFPEAVPMVEGELRGVAEDAWVRAVCRLVEDGPPGRTAWMSRTVRHGSSGWPSGPPRRRADPPHRRPTPSPASPVRAGWAMFSFVPGISPVMRAACSPPTAASPRSRPSHLRSTSPPPASVGASCSTGRGAARRVPRIRRLRPRARGARPRIRTPRRWILTDSDEDAEPVVFDRPAISLRALRSAADGGHLVDGLTGEVLQTEAEQGSD